MADFTYKWGEDVRAGILDAWNLLYPQKNKEAMEFVVYAFDEVLTNDLSVVEYIVEETIKENPEMVDKAKKNPKMQGWFAGQVIKKGAKSDPKIIADVIRKKFELL